MQPTAEKPNNAISATLRTLAALCAGLLLNFLTIALMEQLGHWLYPLPLDLNWEDSSASTAYVKSLPIGALLFLLLGWCSGVWIGIICASAVAGRARGRFALTIGGFVFIASCANFVLIPHPLWLVISTLLLVPLVSLLSWWGAKQFFMRRLPHVHQNKVSSDQE